MLSVLLISTGNALRQRRAGGAARPLPFAMLTLALAQMLKSLSTLQVQARTGGDDGLTMTFSGSCSA